MKGKKIMTVLAWALCLAAGVQAQQTEVIAHRGYWKTEGSAQNSLTALVKADGIGCYGSEFDVWLTADDRLVVNHDTKFKGVTPEEATERVCTSVVLDNGEQLPTLKQYLQIGKALKTKLVLEFKVSKLSEERQTLGVEKIVALVKEMGLEERTEYIAFSLHATKEFIRLAPKGTPVYYLNGDLSPQALKEIGAAGADYHHSVFKKNPTWIKQCHDLGMEVNAWTVNDAETMQWLIREQADFITTNEPELLQQVISEEKKK
ncbi:MAG: glycerophosphodiester phosphodiesterase [Bacteroides sp.]|nr:glycerophosphodiester phosphodiesterase [Bacteroides sp.]